MSEANGRDEPSSGSEKLKAKLEAVAAAIGRHEQLP